MRLLVTACLAVLPLIASAQSPVDLNTEFFRPATGKGFFGISGSQILQNMHFKGDVLLNFADGSLVAFDANGEAFLFPVESQLVLDVVVALGLFNFAELGVAFPVALNQTGDSLEPIGGVGAISGGAPGDLRFVGKARILGTPKQKTGFFLAFAPELTVPTGSGGEFFGAASTAVKLALNAEWKSEKFAIGATAGPRFQDRVVLDQVAAGNELAFGAGAQFQALKPLALLAELDAVQTLEEDGQSPIEARAGVKISLPKGLFIPIGAGFGLNQEVGAPGFRVFAGVTFSPQEQIKDTDSDGLVDSDDECPKDAEDKDNFEDADGCPDNDNDKDTIADAQDSCPLEAGPIDTQGCPDADEDGTANANDPCPKTPGPKESQGCPDTDQDSIADNKDKCVTEPEDKDNFEDTDGCPEEDNDNDKIADKDDICPDEPENYNKVKDNDGCPDVDEVATKPDTKPDPQPVASSSAETVYYSTGQSALTKENRAKIDLVVAALKEDPSKKGRIEGHADDVGPAEGNLALSKERAEEVYKYMIKKGVKKSQLSYKGYGEKQLAETDKNKESRAKNRRVELFVE
jgi:outer membrane protein OmpA-like peptidoglycan-associated protein